MFSPADLSLIVGAAWPWGPPGARLADVVFAYGAIVLLVGLIVWDAWTTPPPRD